MKRCENIHPTGSRCLRLEGHDEATHLAIFDGDGGRGIIEWELKDGGRVNILVESRVSVGTLALDSFDRARAVHRVVRALNDGECPNCQTLRDSREVRQDNGDLICPTCGFEIKKAEADAAIELFAEPMARALAIFAQWRATL
jgi:rubrerythrin